MCWTTIRVTVGRKLRPISLVEVTGTIVQDRSGQSIRLELPSKWHKIFQQPKKNNLLKVFVLKFQILYNLFLKFQTKLYTIFSPLDSTSISHVNIVILWPKQLQNEKKDINFVHLYHGGAFSNFLFSIKMKKKKKYTNNFP